MSSAAAATVESVRLDPELSPELSQALRERAGQESRTISAFRKNTP
jgi:hypothetical protein